MALTLNQMKVSKYNGDLPNFLIDQYMDQVFLEIQQMDTEVPAFMMPESMEPGHKQKWIPFAKKIDGTDGASDTMTSGRVTGIADGGNTNIREVDSNSRYAETRNEYQETFKRRVTTRRFRYSPLIDRLDEKLLFGNPNSWIFQQVRALYKRQQEDICIAGFDASVSEGYDDSSGDFVETSVPFPATQIIDSGGSDIFTYDKYLDGLKLFRDNDIDLRMETPVLLVGPRQHRDLQDQDKLINFDFVSDRNLEKIQIQAMPDGTPVLVSTRLDVTDSVRDCYLWLPSGMMYVTEEEFYQSVSTRNDRNDATQIHTEHASGVVRLYDEKVIKIQCSEVAVA